MELEIKKRNVFKNIKGVLEAYNGFNSQYITYKDTLLQLEKFPQFYLSYSKQISSFYLYELMYHRIKKYKTKIWELHCVTFEGYRLTANIYSSVKGRKNRVAILVKLAEKYIERVGLHRFDKNRKLRAV